MSNEIKATNIVWSKSQVTREDREAILGQKGVTIWFTGLPASGKSTIAHWVEEKLIKEKKLAYNLDGDNIRHGLNKDLGFSPEDREENIRRIGEVAWLFTRVGIITLVSFISPYKRDRDRARALMGERDFIEVYVNCPLEVCEARDPKGLYRKARSGEIKDFTGISAPYEPPENPEIVLYTAEYSIEDCGMKVYSYLKENGYI